MDIIVHNGALVHWVYPYAKLKPMNVDSTVELLRLACTSKVCTQAIARKAGDQPNIADVYMVFFFGGGLVSALDHFLVHTKLKA